MRYLGFITLVCAVAAYSCDNSLITSATEKAAAWEAYASTQRHRHGPVEHAHARPGSHGGAAAAAAAVPAPRAAGAPPALAASRLPLAATTLAAGGRGYAAQQSVLAWLRMFDPERLLYSFRATANLSTGGAAAYGGWEAPTSLLRGHITGGHFLSAAAQAVATTRDAAVNATLTALVAGLAACQAANAPLYGAGYLSAFPPAQFDCLENGVSKTCPIWSPFYTIAKILRGLYDAHTLAGAADAADVAQGMLAYFAARIRGYIAAHTVAEWWPKLNAEFGGLNDAAWLWYSATGSADALFLADVAFDKACLLGPLALQRDYLAGIHANTHIPIVVGAAQGYESAGAPGYEQAARGYIAAVTDGHTFATGGSSTGEWWGEPHRLGDALDVNGVESCTTYNTLKVARALFSWSLDAGAMDLYERAKYSGMFGTMHPTAVGRIIYLLPLRGPDGLAGGSKARSYWGWSDPLASMWCCVGSGLESHSKHGELLFMEQVAAPVLLVTLFDDADVVWPVPGGGGAVVSAAQRAVWDARGVTVTVTLTASPPGGGGGGGTRFALALRVPGWAEAPSATLDGAPLAPAGGWFNSSVRGDWRAAGSVLVARLPFLPRLERLDDDRPQFAAHAALVAGPFALGALTRVDDLLIGANATGSAPPWVRPLAPAERAAARSLAAPGLVPGAFLRHDNNTAALAALVELPGGGGGALTWMLQPAGFLAAGDDLFHGPLTLAQGQAMCANMSSCVGLTYDSPDARPAAAVDMYLKSAASFTAAAGWTTYLNSRAGDALGGDDDGGDSTWILDAPLAAAAPAGAVSLRSLNRPGEYLACPAAGGAPCAIAHGPRGAAFNASATFVAHSPGLTGAAGSVSYESAAAPGAYLSFAGGAPPAAPLSLQPLRAGDGAFANASTFLPSLPNWLPGPLAYVAQTQDDDGSLAGSRDFLLLPIADIASEWYGVYLRVLSTPPAAEAARPREEL